MSETNRCCPNTHMTFFTHTWISDRIQTMKRRGFNMNVGQNLVEIVFIGCLPDTLCLSHFNVRKDRDADFALVHMALQVKTK